MALRSKILLTLLFVLALLSVALGVMAYRTYDEIEDYKVPQRPGAYELKSGYTARRVAEDLAGDAFFKPFIHVWVMTHPELSAVQKGDYAIDGSKTLKQILEDMVAGNVQVKIYPTLAIVEGSTFEQLKDRILKLKRTTPKDLETLEKAASFMRATLKDEALLESLGGAHDSLEGLLMPATYPVFDNKTCAQTVGRALYDMAVFMQKHYPDRADRVTITPYEVLIMASIIERETLLDDERPQVAAVFYNRLDKKMRLQTDPTVAYGISPKFTGRLTRAMLEAETPYNTYRIDGLPPTPISMPRRESILAALHPADTKALYFVARDISPKDGHVFTDTLEAHNRAAAQYRRKVKEYYAKQKAQQKAGEKAQQKAGAGQGNNKKTENSAKK